MEARMLRLGFLLATGIIALAFVFAPAPQSAPLLVAGLCVGSALLFLLSAWLADIRSILPGLLGSLACGTASLLLLHDPAVAGAATGGFWAIVIACWLAAALCVVNLATVRKLKPAHQRVVNIGIPLLFGATVFYLWEVAVRGFGVPPVLLPSPSAAAARFAASLPILAGDFVQTFIRGVLIGYVIGCGAGLLVAMLAQRFEFLGRGLLPLGNFFSALTMSTSRRPPPYQATFRRVGCAWATTS
jgi:NitT/TauT family transport system permease protein